MDYNVFNNYDLFKYVIDIVIILPCPFRGSVRLHTSRPALKYLRVLFICMSYNSGRHMFFDDWFVVPQVQQVFLAAPHRDTVSSMSLHLGWNKGAVVVVTKQWHFFSLHRWAISLSWGPACFTDNTVISCKLNHWQMNPPPSVQEPGALFSNYFDKYINYDCGWQYNQMIRLPGWSQHSGCCSSGFWSCHSQGWAAYHHLSHSLSHFLHVVIKWRFSDWKWLPLRGASLVSHKRHRLCGLLSALPSTGHNSTVYM